MSLSNTEKTVKDIRRKNRRTFSTEEKIRIVLDGLRGEVSIAELCRREGINSNLYYDNQQDTHPDEPMCLLYQTASCPKGFDDVQSFNRVILSYE